MATPRQDPQRPALRLLASPEEEPLEEFTPSPLSAPRRPGERREALTFAAGPGVRALTAEAAAAGVDLDLAVTAVLERRRAEHGIEASLGAEAREVMAALDTAAASARAAIPAGDATAAYVRGLLARRPYQPPAVDDRILVAVPQRLVDVLGSGDAEEAALRVDLESALRWELAAALAAQSVGEWAAWTTLRLRGAAT